MARSDLGLCANSFHPQLVLRRRSTDTGLVITPACKDPECFVKVAERGNRADRLALACFEWFMHGKGSPVFQSGIISKGIWDRERKALHREGSWALRFPTLTSRAIEVGQLGPKPKKSKERQFEGETFFVVTNSGVFRHMAMPLTHPAPTLYGTLETDPPLALDRSLTTITEADGHQVVGVRRLRNLFLGALDGLDVRGGRVVSVGLPSTQPRIRSCPNHGEVWNTSAFRDNPDKPCHWCGALTMSRYEELGWTKAKGRDVEDILEDSGWRLRDTTSLDSGIDFIELEKRPDEDEEEE